MFKRLKRYISINTKSNEANADCPSSEGQLELAQLLKDELLEMGISAHVDQYGYVYAKLSSNVDYPTKTIGLIAHMDTAPDLEGKVDHPQVLTYQGGDIRLNDQYSIKEEDFPFLSELKGQTLMTTDGTTLLGSDDKSGISIIMEVVQTLIEHPEIKHGAVHIAFTPDEEIGRGADYFDVEGFGADFAFTLDGGSIGKLEYENFNAAGVHIQFFGKNIHPGSAKGALINAMQVAIDFHQSLPVHERPEYTEQREGFFMLRSFDGGIEQTTVEYIIREHDAVLFEKKKELIKDSIASLEKKYGTEIVYTIKDQ